jgi:hypothetical protein
MKLIKIAFAALTLSFSANVLAEVDPYANPIEEETTIPAVWQYDKANNTASVVSNNDDGNLSLTRMIDAESPSGTSMVAILRLGYVEEDCTVTNNKPYQINVAAVKVVAYRFCAKDRMGMFNSGFTMVGKDAATVVQYLSMARGQNVNVAGKVFTTNGFGPAYRPLYEQGFH